MDSKGGDQFPSLTPWGVAGWLIFGLVGWPFGLWWLWVPGALLMVFIGGSRQGRWGGSTMANKPCPCGCGRRIGYGERRMASRGVELRQLLPAAERMLVTCDESERPIWDAIIKEGNHYTSRYMLFGHRQSDPMGAFLFSQASAAELAQMRLDADEWEAKAMRIKQFLRTNDQGWYSANF